MSDFRRGLGYKMVGFFWFFLVLIKDKLDVIFLRIREYNKVGFLFRDSRIFN